MERRFLHEFWLNFWVYRHVLVSEQRGSTEWDSSRWGGSIRYHKSVLNGIVDRPGLAAFVGELDRAMGGRKTNVLIAGRSEVFFDRRVALELRCVERMGSVCGAQLPGPYLNETFQRSLEGGAVRLKDFNFGAVAYVRHLEAGDREVAPFPNAEMVKVIEEGKHQLMGLKRMDDIRAEIPGLPKAIEFYLVE